MSMREEWNESRRVMLDAWEAFITAGISETEVINEMLATWLAMGQLARCEAATDAVEEIAEQIKLEDGA